MAWYQWRRYVPVAERRAKAQRKMAMLRKKGADIHPVVIEGRKIAKTFWGEAWCSHLESFSDFSNRLPRGRTYVRNGSVCHLAITKGKIKAKVIGSEIYNVVVEIDALPAKKWNVVKKQCAGQIGSILELLRGSLSDNVMAVVTDRKNGLFPLPGEISFDCDCPDWAVMCKHVAAVLYGAGARLDQKPEMLFDLREVNHEELIDSDVEIAITKTAEAEKAVRLATGDLSEIFGIDIPTDDSVRQTKTAGKKTSARKKGGSKKKKKTSRRAPAKKPTAKRTPRKKKKK